MKKTSAIFVALATIAGSLAATPASAQRGAAAGAPGYYYGPAYYGPTAFLMPPACEWATQRFWDGHNWRVRRVRVCG